MLIKEIITKPIEVYFKNLVLDKHPIRVGKIANTTKNPLNAIAKYFQDVFDLKVSYKKTSDIDDGVFSYAQVLLQDSFNLVFYTSDHIKRKGENFRKNVINLGADFVKLTKNRKNVVFLINGKDSIEVKKDVKFEEFEDDEVKRVKEVQIYDPISKYKVAYLREMIKNEKFDSPEEFLITLAQLQNRINSDILANYKFVREVSYAGLDVENIVKSAVHVSRIAPGLKLQLNFIKNKYQIVLNYYVQSPVATRIRLENIPDEYKLQLIYLIEDILNNPIDDVYNSLTAVSLK